MEHRFDYEIYNNVVILKISLIEGQPQISQVPLEHECLIYITEGAIVLEVVNEHTVLKAGQIGYIKKGILPVFRTYQCGQADYIAINFNFQNTLPFKTKQSLPFSVLCNPDSLLDYRLLFFNALQHYIADTSSSQMICKGILMQILGHLYNDWNTPEKIRKTMLRLKPAVTYLQKNFQNSDISIEYISELCNMSCKQFRRLFMEIYGELPYTFLQKLRLNQAKTLLLCTSESIGDISIHCGFSDIYSFSHFFKRQVGISPIKYRKK